jgi:hypothetical protein
MLVGVVNIKKYFIYMARLCFSCSSGKKRGFLFKLKSFIFPALHYSMILPLAVRRRFCPNQNPIKQSKFGVELKREMAVKVSIRPDK